MKVRKAALAAVVAVCFSIAGCNAYQTAQRAHDVVAAVVAVAQADLPSLEQTGIFSSADGAAVTSYLNLATNLDGQYQTCINTANSGTSLTKKGKFLGCLDTFATGLSNPQELAQLRVMSPKAQQEVQLWVTAASVGVSSVIAALGGQPIPTSSLSEVLPSPAPSIMAAQLAFNRRVEAAAGL
ncbi:MAG TPA: hypothetical protein VMF66_01065 [Candidatus Acidoferrum sp.]|nr:hypothetical protein [Candidatus Acidoferrum sp.]